MDKKAEIVELLKEMGELCTLDEGSPQAFRVRAYENARRAIEAFNGDLAAMNAAQLAKLEGIGKSTAQKIREYIDTGRVEKLEALRKKYPPSVVALSQVPGIGPKAVAKLRAELGVESIADLRQAISDQRLRALPGFGEKTEQKLGRTLEKLGLDGGPRRTAIARALPIAERLLAELCEMPGVDAAHYCGSLRRFSETIGDLDLLVAADRSAPIMAWLAEHRLADEVLVRGETKTSIRTRKGLQIDLRVVQKAQLGAALMYFTGSKAHNIKLRQIAMQRGYLLNEYGLEDAKTGKVIASETEEAVYAALGLPFIPAVLREDNGEVERALAGELPEPIPLEAVQGDLHVHTELSGDGRSSLRDMVAAARARGYTFMAITEHAEDLPLQGVKREALAAQREEIAALQRELGDAFTLLHGAELNIGPEGELDYDPEFRRQFDWCLASVHTHFDLSREQQTRRILAAMRDPSVNMIGHLSARTIGKRPPIDLDIDAVLAGAEETGTALEINSGLPRLDVSTDVLRRALGRSVTFVLTSDAHHASELDRMRHGVAHALRGWMPAARIANCWPRERFLAWSRARRAQAAP